MLIWFVGIGTLIAGVIGISNIMLIIVKERTKEIGVKRALGSNTIFGNLGQIILESVFLTFLSGIFWFGYRNTYCWKESTKQSALIVWTHV